jgi:hypothetical protein
VARFCPDADETFMGHLAQQCQNVCSTNLTLPTVVPVLLLPAIAPPTEDTPSNEVFVCIYPISKLYTFGTSCFPIKVHLVSQYVMIAYHADGNIILQQAFKSRGNTCCIAAYNAIMTCLAACGLSVDLQILDNKASAAYKQAISFTWQAKFQLVPPDMHCHNCA